MKNLMQINELKAKRARLITDVQALAVKAPLTGTDADTYRNMIAGVEDIDTKIADLERLNVEDEIVNPFTPQQKKNGGFAAFLRSGDTSGVTMQKVESGAVYAMDKGAASGGALVPTNLADAIWQKAIAENPVTSLCTVMPLDTDTEIPVAGAQPTWNWTAEKARVTASDPTVSKKILKAHKMTGLVKASYELVSDSKFDIEQFVSEQMGISFNAFVENAILNNTASETNKPCGIIASASQMETIGTDKLAYKDIVSLLMAPTAKYRKAGNFVATKKAITNVMTLSDDSKRPIFIPSYAAGQPDILLGRPLHESEAMGEDENGILFGDFKNYIIAQRKTMTVQRLAELYAETNEIGYLFLARMDGILMDDKAIYRLKLKTEGA